MSSSPAWEEMLQQRGFEGLCQGITGTQKLLRSWRKAAKLLPDVVVSFRQFVAFEVAPEG